MTPPVAAPRRLDKRWEVYEATEQPSLTSGAPFDCAQGDLSGVESRSRESHEPRSGESL